ncbi:MAG: cytochrome c biogenesis protein DipZ [Actinomycetota bacterium]
MGILLLIGFVGGLVTGVSPCVLPVLPIVLAGVTGSDDRRRPYKIVAGLVLSFSVFTLIGGALLSALGLPQDFLRTVAIVLLLLVAAGLIIPKLGDMIEKPFARMGLKRQPGARGGFMLGASLGMVYVPCAGPILAAIVVSAARHRIGLETILVTLAYAAGNAIPMLAIAIASRRLSGKLGFVRTHAARVRRIAGIVMAAAAVALFLNVFQGLQTSLPGYASSIQNRLETSSAAKKGLQALTGQTSSMSAETAELSDMGPAPEFTGIQTWLNSPPLKIATLRGKVVLVDFWTYSCINCLRTLPHVESWYRAYHSSGFDIIGVHTPEFAFEHVVSNVNAAAHKLGVVYPIAIDNNFGTWNAYQNQYWPAEYLIDANGRIQHTQFGEGDYSGTESAIRALLRKAGATSLPSPVDHGGDLSTSRTLTPETYLGYSRIDRYQGTSIANDKESIYTLASSLPDDNFTLGGSWTVGSESVTAGPNAHLRLRFSANQVFLVLGGKGTVAPTLDGAPLKTTDVSGYPRTYTLASSVPAGEHTLDLDISSGVQAFDFTFG